MNLEKEMQKLSKRTKNGDVTLQKHWDKMSEIMSRYASTHDTEINNARKQYEWMFDSSCRRAEELNKDLWVVLSDYMFLDEYHLIEPPNTLKNKKEIQVWLKKEFKPYFYECMINGFAAAFMNELSELKKLNSKGGKATVATTKPRRAKRKASILNERKKLIDDGVTNERVILKRIRKIFPNEHSHYIQQTILAEEYKEADERKNQNFAL